MFDALFINAWLVGIALALVAGPLGCFVVWRRMAYFGDTMAHASMLGISLGFVLGVAPTWTVILVVLSLAGLLLLIEQRLQLHSDTLLGYLSHTALALGVVVVSTTAWVRVDLVNLLLGDVLLISQQEALFTGITVAAIFTLLAWLWRPLVALTSSPEIALVEGTAKPVHQWLFTLLLAVFIAIAMKVVGVLLITALLIIPAAAARNLAKTPEQMAVLASLVAVLAVIGGLFGSFSFDAPAGAAIVLSASILFLVFALSGALLKR